MAKDVEVRKKRRKQSGKAPSSKPTRQKTAEYNDSASHLGSELSRPLDIDALRKARVEYLSKPPEEHRTRMKFIGERTVKERVKVVREGEENGRKPASITRRRKASSLNRMLRPRTDREEKGKERADRDDGYVYTKREMVQEGYEGDNDDGEETFESGSAVKVETARRTQTQRIPTQHIPIQRSQTQRTQAERTQAGRSQTQRSTFGRTASERRTLPRRQSEPLRRNSYGIDILKERSREARRSTTSVRPPPRPPLHRSATSVTASARIPRNVDSLQSPISSPTLNPPKAPSSVFSSLFRSSGPNPPTTAEKKVSCLTCGDDEVPISKSARLACSHCMCHPCMRRIFKMSVTDPAHMPPRCCGTDHIPLKHVDKLFSLEFKKTWNRKFQEYTTKSRLYCPARGCGEWIKPNHIAVEKGRKVGKCKKCGTKVCGTCNNRMHTSRDCPKDPATQAFVEVAKEKGWQSCYSCGATVELKEGCNHMTCRCTAEFCMVCGVKWKGCDCPWFNYEQIDAHLGNPVRYQEELERRRVQELADEEIARRMQRLGVDAGVAVPPMEAQQQHHHHYDNIGLGDDLFGVGNAAGHHMNANFYQQARDVLTANYQQAQQAAQGLINGLITGRENRLPGPAAAPNETVQLLRQPSRRATTTHAHNHVPVAADDRSRHAPDVVVDGSGRRGRHAPGVRRPTHGDNHNHNHNVAATAGAVLARHGSVRRRSDMLADPFQGRSQTAGDRRIQDWANGVLPPQPPSPPY